MSALGTRWATENRMGEPRTIHKTPNGLRFKREAKTPILALNGEIGRLCGDRIKALRLERRMTLEELCVRAGIVSGTPKERMWEIESGARQGGLRFGTLYALAMALGVDVCDLLPSRQEVEHIARPVTRTVTTVTVR